MTEILMPSLSDSMQEGTVLTWLKAAGERVGRGDELVEIETDKATMTYESPEEGILEIVVEAGSTVAVGTVIARAQEVASATRDDGAGESAVTEDDGAGESRVVDDDAAAQPTVADDPVPVGAAAAPVEGGLNGDGSVRATPLARRLASAHDVDLSRLSGSGPRGRIRRVDVELAAGVRVESPAPRSSPPAPAPAPGAQTDQSVAPAGDGAKGPVTVVQPTRLQQVIARRMSEAKATIPEFQVEAEVAFDAAIELRAQLKEQGGDRAPSFNDLVVKACALALREHPRANASYRDGAFELYGRVNIGIAVAAQDALVVPTIFDADTRSLGAIAAEAKRLAARVRGGEITPPELSGATFTVSNLGMYGMSAITPVINPPQAAILGVGATRALPAIVDGKLTERHVLTLRLSCDHRILYGADAAELLSDIRSHLEQPLRLML
ncbi:MAG: dihydrolipoamide acetyltransferase family protein [Solirubrobacteraceae bacterium]